MRAVSALVLVILGAFIRRSDAIRCYYCQTENGDYCDKFNEDDTRITKYDCPSNYNACGMARGTAKLHCKNTSCTSCTILVRFLFFHIVTCRGQVSLSLSASAVEAIS